MKLPSRFAPTWATKNGCRGWAQMNAAQRIDERSTAHQDIIDMRTSEDNSRLSSELIEAGNLFYEQVDKYKSVDDSNNYFDITMKCNEIHELFEAKIDFYSITLDTLTVIKFEASHTDVSVEENMDLLSQAVSIVNHHHTFTYIRLIIVQPFSYSEQGPVKVWSITEDDIKQYQSILSAAAEECTSESAQTLSGSHCKNCYVRKNCLSALKASTQLYEVASDPNHIEMNSDQLGLQLRLVNRAIESLKTLKTAYESQVEFEIGNGLDVPCWSLKPSYGREVWTATVDEIIDRANDVDVVKTVPITPSQARKLGIDTTGMTCKPDRGFKLVESDTLASNIFKNSVD